MQSSRYSGSGSAAGHDVPKLLAFIVCDDDALTEDLASRLAELSAFVKCKSFPSAVPQEQFIRALRVYAPNAIFLHTQDLAAAERLARLAEAHIHNVKIVGIHRTCAAEHLLQVMRLGIHEFLSAPLTNENVAECCDRVRAMLSESPAKTVCTDLVYSFLPAKAGVGASTIAVNCAALAAQNTSGRVFLGDFDLNSGIVRFMLKLTNPYSVIDAVNCGGSLDRGQWDQIVEARGNLDVVHAGNIDLDVRISPDNVRELLLFTRRSYDLVCADLSGNLEKFSLEIMRESKIIFLVTTPELPALHLAREKVRFLDTLGLRDQVAIVLNRENKRHPLSAADVEGAVGAPVLMSLPNDYAHLHRAIQNGSALDRSSPLGAKFSELARRMLAKEAQKAPARKRFLEYFAVVPTKYRINA